MKLLIAFILSCFIYLRNYTAFTASNQVTERETKVLRLVTSLPEVVRANRYVIKHTNGKRKLTTNIDSEPSTEHPHYHLSVSEFNGPALVPHFHFIVDAKTYEVKLWAVGEDKVLSLQAWRKRHYKDY